MAFIPGSNLLMVELFQRLDDQRLENTLYFQFINAAALEANAANLLDDLLVWWQAEIAPSLSNAISLIEAKGTDLTTATSEVYTSIPSSPIPGTVVDESLPSNVALCVSFRTTARGRSNRGRNYVAGIPGLSVTLNTVSQTFADAMTDGYGALPPIAAAQDCTWVVASRFTGGLPRVGIAVRAVTSVAVTDLTVDSQRRRLPGRGA